MIRRMGFFRRDREESRSLTTESLPPVMLPPTVIGEGVSTRNALAISSVFSCVQALTSASLLCPLEVYRRLATGERQQITTGKLTDLLTTPAPAVTGPALTARLMQSLALHGEAMLGKYRDGDGQIASLGVIDPTLVSVTISKGVPSYRYSAPDGTQFPDLGTADITHVVGVCDHTGIRGLSPIAACREAFGLASALTTAASATVANGGLPSGILTVPAGPTGQDQAKSLSTEWKKRTGPDQKGKIAVLTGDVGWIAVSMSPEDLQFVQQTQMSLADIARLFGLPPSRVNAQSQDSMTYSTTLAEATAFTQTALGPRLKLIESAISNDPDLCNSPTFVEYNLDGLLRGDSLTRAEWYTLGLNPVTGWLRRSEVRDYENLPHEAEPAAEPVLPPAKPPSLTQIVGLEPRSLEVTNGVGRISE